MAIASDINPYQGIPKGDNPFAQITDNVARIAEAPKPHRIWYVSFGCALLLLSMFGGSIGYMVWNGIGVWGNMLPVA